MRLHGPRGPQFSTIGRQVAGSRVLSCVPFSLCFSHRAALESDEVAFLYRATVESRLISSRNCRLGLFALGASTCRSWTDDHPEGPGDDLQVSDTCQRF